MVYQETKRDYKLTECSVGCRQRHSLHARFATLRRECVRDGDCNKDEVLCSLHFLLYLKSASNLNGNLNCSKELEHYAS